MYNPLALTIHKHGFPYFTLGLESFALIVDYEVILTLVGREGWGWRVG